MSFALRKSANGKNTSKTYTITGGTQVGTTQFHSFQDFSVPTGNTAHFDSLLTTTNVIGRVTGSNISNIDGILKTNGSTNLYLINPNGIIFGAKAKLDIAGSFTASTANSIKFSDGSEFSATNPQAPPLLQVTIPLGLQYGKSNVGATITNSGSLEVGQDLVLNADKLDLQGRLQSARDLTLQAQDSISIINGVLSTSTSSSSVRNAGNITINAGSLYLNNSSISANTFGKGNAGNIIINVADSIKFDGKSSAASQVAPQTGIGNAGGVRATAHVS
ncbi:MAG: filamentous hemagglutinin N-terminal domain-containing protein [Pseudanabaena sp. ELA645]|jgi:filamentous hemagglutinin family protein